MRGRAAIFSSLGLVKAPHNEKLGHKAPNIPGRSTVANANL